MALALGGAALLGTAAGFAIRHFGDDPIEEMLGDDDESLCMWGGRLMNDCDDLTSEACKANKYCELVEVGQYDSGEPCMKQGNQCIANPNYLYDDCDLVSSFQQTDCGLYCATKSLDECPEEVTEKRCTADKKLQLTDHMMDCELAYYEEFCKNFTEATCPAIDHPTAAVCKVADGNCVAATESLLAKQKEAKRAAGL